ncbi:hypothetical protein PM082_023829 [Marasmius tenuissimus]|nr:hypothetical protein PM082_023829 [Marasmius tenuissimus]
MIPAAQPIQQLIAGYLTQSSNLPSEDQASRLIRTGAKNPILVIDGDTLDISSTHEGVQTVLHPAEFNGLEELKNRWHGPEMRAAENTSCVHLSSQSTSQVAVVGDDGE